MCAAGNNQYSAEDHGRKLQGAQPITAEQLFALVVLLYASEGRNSARVQFSQATELVLTGLGEVSQS